MPLSTPHAPAPADRAPSPSGRGPADRPTELRRAIENYRRDLLVLPAPQRAAVELWLAFATAELDAVERPRPPASRNLQS